MSENIGKAVSNRLLVMYSILQWVYNFIFIYFSIWVFMQNIHSLSAIGLSFWSNLYFHIWFMLIVICIHDISHGVGLDLTKKNLCNWLGFQNLMHSGSLLRFEIKINDSFKMQFWAFLYCYWSINGTCAK